MPERDMVWSLPEDLPLDDFLQLGQLLLVIQRLCFLMQRMGTRDRDVELHCGGMGRRDWSSLLLWARHLVGASAGEDRSYLRMKTNVPGTPEFALQLRAQIEHGHAAVPTAGQQAAAPAPAAAPAAAQPAVGKRKAAVSPTPASVSKRRSVPPPFRPEAGLRVLNLLSPMLEHCLKICPDL
jgi:Pyruvate/2-oxoglutarate dehydrogenase complex, dihydrolipoamide acyltransferase (E2) component, and related enzymes